MNITLEKTIVNKMNLHKIQGSKKASRKFTLDYDVETFEKDNERFIVRFNVIVQDTSTFKMSIEYIAVFKTTETVSEIFLHSDFAKINAPAIAYPFLRSYISFVTLNSGYAPAMLPTINFVVLSKKKFK